MNFDFSYPILSLGLVHFIFYHCTMRYFFFILVFLAFLTPHAQDTIRLRDGRTIIAIIHQVEETRIQYHLFTYSDGPLFVKNTNSINWIKYRNGSIDSFQIQTLYNLSNSYADSLSPNGIFFTNKEIDSIALSDAHKYYSASGIGTNILLTTILTTPATGLITSLIVNATPPKFHNLNIPDKPIAENPRYINKYKEGAYEIKRDKVAANFSAGMIITLVATFFYIVISN